jgi:3',5'-cyclic AMP phosphodiesterase CpdA
MKLLQISDLHIVPPGETLFGSDPAARLRACIDDVNLHHADADLVVITGDLTHDGDPAAYDVLSECLASLIPPVQLLVGNHDERKAFREAFPHVPTDAHGFIQSVYHGENGQCIFLDTLEPGTPEGRLCERRLEWLAATLDAARGTPVYLFSHHPAFDLALPSMDWIRLREEMAFRALVAGHGDVRHMFAGHVHRPSSGTWYGTPFTTVRGTNHQHALEFGLNGPATTVMEPPGYAVIFVRESGTVVHFHDFMDQSARFPYSPVA